MLHDMLSMLIHNHPPDSYYLQVSQVFNKLQMKMEEIRMNRQFQTYIDKLKPLLKAGRSTYMLMDKRILETGTEIHLRKNF